MGQANIYEEDLNSFLAIAEEIELKGWTGQTSSDLLEDQKEPKHSEPAKMCVELLSSSNIDNALMKSRTVKMPKHPVPNLQELDEKVKSTRSSWLNCALRDDEAVYWVSIGHYEAVAFGNG